MSFIDDWKEWSTIKKVISIVIVCCFGLVIVGSLMGGLSPDKNTATVTNDNSNSDNSVDASNNQVHGVQVHIITDGSWSGSVGDGSSQSSHDGTGEDTIDLGDADYNIVSAVIQKRSGDSSELKVEILKDGKVIKESSTTAEYGVVSVSTSI